MRYILILLLCHECNAKIFFPFETRLLPPIPVFNAPKLRSRGTFLVVIKQGVLQGVTLRMDRGHIQF